MIKQTVLVFVSTLNYKDTLWSVPFETSLGTEMALMHILFFSKFICFCNPIKEYCQSPIQQQATEKQLPKLFLQADFSLSANFI
jgi:iron complex outermembrane receptor protein